MSSSVTPLTAGAAVSSVCLERTGVPPHSPDRGPGGIFFCPCNLLILINYIGTVRAIVTTRALPRPRGLGIFTPCCPRLLNASRGGRRTTPETDPAARHRRQGLLPIGNGHAPGTAIGRGATGVGPGIARGAGFPEVARFLAAGCCFCFFLTAFFFAGFRAGFFLPALRLAFFRVAALRTTFFFNCFFFAVFFLAAFFFAFAMRASFSFISSCAHPCG